MNCPVCKEQALKEILTKEGVAIDYCGQCHGIWLDKGEIYLFARKPAMLDKQLNAALAQKTPTQKKSPKADATMDEISIFEDKLKLDICPKTQGIWFDGGELDAFNSLQKKTGSITLDTSSIIEEPSVDIVDEEKKRAARGRLALGSLLPLPNLFIRSASVLIGLYALLGLVLLTVYPPQIVLPLAFVLVVLQFVFSPWIMDLSLRFCYEMDWVQPNGLPSHLRAFIEKTCQGKNMKFPSVGIIHDGSPNAFTYGHTPNNARIVITSGLMDLLQPEEVEAVVAHEIGHAVHWDMALMTIAQLVPLIFYVIFRTLIRMRSRGNDKSAPARIAIAIGSYIVYIISTYIVLWFSRTREYYADRFAGEVTQEPSALASALVKIAYGLAGQDKKEKGSSRKETMNAIGAMGIFDKGAAQSLAVASLSSTRSMGGMVDKTTLKGAMKWDLWNPWAKFYELHSTHPLTANRLRFLSDQSAHMDKKPYVVFDFKKPESYWDEFFSDVFIYFLPAIGLLTGLALAFLTNNGAFFGMALSLYALGRAGKLLFAYKGKYFPEMSISGLLRKVKVSAVRPVPCTLKGTIIGRGVPGLIWSEDFVMKDETGIIFLDYRQPLRILEWFFGLLRARQLHNQPVTVTGWFRRAPVPYIEMKTITTGGTTRTCHVYTFKWIITWILFAAGVVVAFVV